MLKFALGEEIFACVLERPASTTPGTQQRPSGKILTSCPRSDANPEKVVREFQAAVYVTSKTASNTIAVFFGAVFLLQLPL